MDKGEEKYQTHILINEDVSEDKVKFLIQLGYEEERLDYKENLDFSTKPLGKKSKIDLTCDLISMANHEGGYIIIGVSETDDRKFQVTGVGEECTRNITQEDLMNIVSNYCDARVKILVKVHTVDEMNIILIFISKSNIFIPFKQDGQYGENGGNKTKFQRGDVFVRHGAISQKAKYEDISRFVENIREDERRKTGSTAKGLGQIAGRLDRLVEIFDGKQDDILVSQKTTATVQSDPVEVRKNTNSIQKDSFILKEQVFENSSEEIEAYFREFLGVSGRTQLFRRTINKGFSELKRILKELESTPDKEERIEILNREVPTFLSKLIPIWIAITDTDDVRAGKILADRIYQLYEFTFSLEGSYRTNSGHRLYMQTEIVKLIYCLGAISINEDRPDLSKSLINRKGPVANYDGWSDNEYWFRYVTTMLFRANQMTVPGLVMLSYNYFKNNDYLHQFFDDIKDIEKYMAQFDFLQCLNTYVEEMGDHACWPAFMIYDKRTVEPIIRKIIESHSENRWLDVIEESSTLAKHINDLDNYDMGSSSFTYRRSWAQGRWYDEKISQFLKNNLKE